jgi:hypothetical protein
VFLVRPQEAVACFLILFILHFLGTSFLHYGQVPPEDACSSFLNYISMLKLKAIGPFNISKAIQPSKDFF